MSEVLTINVRGFHTNTALAVHGCSLLTSTHQSSTLWDSSRDDWGLSPHRRLSGKTALAVLPHEWASSQILAVAILRQTECLVIQWVHDHTISIQTSSQLNFR